MKKILCFVLLLATALLFASCGSTTTIKVQDYIEVTFEPAYNGYAEPNLEIDEEGLDSLMNHDKTIAFLKELMEKDEEYADYVEEFLEMVEEDPDSVPGFTTFFTIDFDKNYTKLKNGDKVTVTVSLDKYLAEITDACS